MSTIKLFIHKFFLRISWQVALFLTALTIISYGPFLPGLGFYWDDWAKILVYRLQGPGGYWLYYLGDRPLSSWTHIVLTPLLGVTPTAWQVFTLSMRLSTSLGIYLLLNLVFPGRKFSAAAAAGIFLVYPIFSQQPIAVTLHQQWLQYVLLIFSFLFMSLAVRSTHRRVLWSALSILLSILQLSVTEYFAPLELVRPFLIWAILDGCLEKKDKLRLTIKYWLPYFVLMVLFVVVRLFAMPRPIDVNYQGEGLFQYLSNPLQSIITLAKNTVVDLVYMLFSGWAPAFETRLSQPISLTYLAILFLCLAAGILTTLALVHFQKIEPEENRRTFPLKSAAAIGLAGLFLGPVPAWALQDRVVFDGHSDRYALPALFGLSILTVCAIEWLGRSRVQKALLTGFIIFLGCGYQLRNSFDYQTIWRQQLQLYWQLSWRAPMLKSPTSIYSETELIKGQELFSMSAALNQLYPQDSNPDLVDFWFYTLRPKYNAGPPAGFSISNDTTWRSLHFMANNPDTLLIQNDPSHGNCLWVLRPEDKLNPYLPELTREMLPISNLKRITGESTGGYPPEELFGKEPEHDWCFNYEKAELAWQLEDWDEIIRIGDEIRALGISPLSPEANSPREWWPFIAGYANSGQTNTAIEISQQCLLQDKRYHEAICSLWNSFSTAPGAGISVSELGCPE